MSRTTKVPPDRTRSLLDQIRAYLASRIQSAADSGQRRSSQGRGHEGSRQPDHGIPHVSCLAIDNILTTVQGCWVAVGPNPVDAAHPEQADEEDGQPRLKMTKSQAINRTVGESYKMQGTSKITSC